MHTQPPALAPRPGLPAAARPTGRTLTADELAVLRASVTGPVLVPDDEGYASEVAAWNELYTSQPAVVVGATDVADVRAAVGAARRHGLRVAVASTGHGSVIPADGALLVTTRRMRGVRVDPRSRVVRVEAGALWQDVVDAAAVHGLAPLAGSSPDVGAVGYTLGGGLSPSLGRRYGWAADHLVAAELVTADGLPRHVLADSDPELFWALRGGRGGLGVVTALHLALFPVAELYAGGLFLDADRARPALRAWLDLAASAPDEMSTSFAFLRLPDAPFVPEPLRDRVTLHVRIAWSGARETGERLVAPLRAVGGVLLDTVAPMPLTAVASIHQDPPGPLPVHERSTTLTALPWTAVERLLEVAGPGSATTALLVEVRLLGGALGRPPRVPSAVAGREAAFVAFAAAVAPPEAASLVGADLEAVVGALRPWATGETLPNFATPDRAASGLGTSWRPEDGARLARVRRRVDPVGLFRTVVAPVTTGVPAVDEGVDDVRD